MGCNFLDGQPALLHKGFSGFSASESFPMRRAFGHNCRSSVRLHQRKTMKSRLRLVLDWMRREGRRGFADIFVAYSLKRRRERLSVPPTNWFQRRSPANPAVEVLLQFCRENMFVREILKAKLREPGGESRWKPRETGRNDLDAATGDPQSSFRFTRTSPRDCGHESGICPDICGLSATASRTQKPQSAEEYSVPCPKCCCRRCFLEWELNGTSGNLNGQLKHDFVSVELAYAPRM